MIFFLHYIVFKVEIVVFLSNNFSRLSMMVGSGPCCLFGLNVRIRNTGITYLVRGETRQEGKSRQHLLMKISKFRIWIRNNAVFWPQGEVSLSAPQYTQLHTLPVLRVFHCEREMPDSIPFQ